MSERVKRYLPTLKRLRRMSEKHRCDYVRQCDRQFIDCISECSKNVLYGNVPLTSRQKAHLRSKRQDLRALATTKTSLRKKRKIIQKGGLLSALLPPLLTLLGGLLLK